MLMVSITAVCCDVEVCFCGMSESKEKHCRCESVNIGEPVEVVVLAKNANFSEFKVLREVYFPFFGLFLADYPFIKRAEFIRVSTSINESRSSEQPSQDDMLRW